MSSPDLENFAGRPFSFYPPILNIEHNEWVYMQGTWSEVLVQNTKTEMELWVPRRYVGEISRVDEPVMIVGLNKELEYKGGTVWPHSRRVLRMPGAAERSTPGEHQGREETASRPSWIRRGSAAERKIGRLIGATLVVGILACVLLVAYFRGTEAGGRVNYKAILQAELGLTGQDNYYAVVRKLGEPAEDRWRSDAGERQYRALWYPDLSVTIILMGAERDQVLYIGAKDRDWKTVHSVELPGRTKTDSILRSLEPF